MFGLPFLDKDQSEPVTDWSGLGSVLNRFRPVWDWYRTGIGPGLQSWSSPMLLGPGPKGVLVPVLEEIGQGPGPDRTLKHYRQQKG